MKLQVLLLAALLALAAVAAHAATRGAALPDMDAGYLSIEGNDNDHKDSALFFMFHKSLDMSAETLTIWHQGGAGHLTDWAKN